jgi:ornithine carbamoyltransferase
MPPENFLDISDFDAEVLNRILSASRKMKEGRAGKPKAAREEGEPLKGVMLAMIFERPSTRTRASFEAAIRQLGGEAMVINAGDMQLGRGETVADTARVLSRYADAIMMRAADHSHLTELAQHAGVPVINGLTDKSHPCQVMADVQTIEEKLGPLAKQNVAWVGDGNNVAASWIHAVSVLGGTLRLACPNELSPKPEVLEFAAGKRAQVRLGNSAEEAVAGADCVITDAWASMHDKDTKNRHNLLKPYRVDAALMKRAAPHAIFMHCLPAHRGEEVTDEVIDGPQSAVFDEAENRLHVQKAILLHCFGALK